VKNKFPMPIIDEIFDELAGTKYFTKLDMHSGYHQIHMKKEDEYKTVFRRIMGTTSSRSCPLASPMHQQHSSAP
jgi:hypothetical protein